VRYVRRVRFLYRLTQLTTNPSPELAGHKRRDRGPKCPQCKKSVDIDNGRYYCRRCDEYLDNMPAKD